MPKKPPAEDLLAKVSKGQLSNGTVPIDQEQLKKLSTLNPERLEKYALYAEYYDGKQQVLMPDRLKQFLERQALEWSENFVETVADTLAGRLAVSGFTTSLVANDEDPLADWIQRYVWEKNRMDAVQAQVHDSAIQKGDAFLLVDWNNARGCPRLAFNRPDMIEPEWDDDGNMVHVVKVWNTKAKALTNPQGVAIRRMNIYYPDRVEKYYRLSERGKEEWSLHLDDDDTTWPTAWQTPDEEPLGIPVFHFANRPGSNHWGHSEIAGVIPQQNLLNKQILDLASVLDTQGYPQRYAVGVESGENLKTAPGEVWTTAVPGAQMGQFEAAELDPILNAIEKTLLRMSARSQTPSHLLVMTAGGAPSGESLKTSEAGLVKKAQGRSVPWGDTWSDVMLLATRLAVIYAKAEYRPPVQTADWADLTINTSWVDPQSRNLKDLLETLKIEKELGVSTHTILTKIPDIDADQELEQKEMEMAEAGEELMNFINRGAKPGQPVRRTKPKLEVVET